MEILNKRGPMRSFIGFTNLNFQIWKGKHVWA
jgi:hypothetical protein